MTSRTAALNARNDHAPCIGNIRPVSERRTGAGELLSVDWEHCRHCPGDHIAMICHW